VSSIQQTEVLVTTMTSLGITLAVGIAFALAPMRAEARTIHVDQTTCTLANAINSANANHGVGGCVLAGTGSAFTIELNNDVTLTAPDPSEADSDDGPSGLPRNLTSLVINGNGHTIQRDPALFAVGPYNGDGSDPCSGTGPKFRIVIVSYVAPFMTLNDVTIKNGCVEGLDHPYAGGGILQGLGLTLNNVTITNNKASVGGGIFKHTSTSPINNSTITGNSAQSGGGIFVRRGTLAMTNSTLAQNSATGESGSVCLVAVDEPLCAAVGGGGLSMISGSVTITDSTLRQNSAWKGGAIRNAGGTLNVNRSTVLGNQAHVGGGLYVDVGTVSVTNTTFAQNEAVTQGPEVGDGGGIYSAGGTTRVFNATLGENTATGRGGGIFTRRHADKQLSLTNTILDNVTGGNCFVDGAALFSIGHNLATDNTCKLSNVGDHQNVADLKLAAYTDPGTAGDGRYPLLPGSPAIDAGTNAGCTATDQMGETRVGACDIGAVEYPRRAKVWIGVGGGGGINLRVDLKAEMYVDGALAGQGQLTNQATGGVGFNNAILYTIPLPVVDVPSGLLLELKISARRTCAPPGLSAGTVRLWFDGQPVDSGASRGAGSRVGATLAGLTSNEFLHKDLTLDDSPGAASTFREISLDSISSCPARPFTKFDTWSVTP
jgi:hypothetical protein